MTIDPKMNEAPLSRVECLAACKRFVGWGLEFTLLPVLSTPHASAVWHSKVEVETEVLNDVFNVGVRPGKNPDGSFTAFGIKIVDDSNYQIPLRQTSAYRFLNDLSTLRFEDGSSAVFVFSIDKYTSVSEHYDYREPIYLQPLKNALLVSQSGWTGWGVCNNHGRSSRVTCHGDEPLDVRKVPALVDALKRTGKFTMSNSAYLGNVMTGPPLL
jgi:hypothetical protein